MNNDKAFRGIICITLGIWSCVGVVLAMYLARHL